ncbi:MAG: metal-dependent hydrolase [Kiritimatiellia bacterium]
MASPVFHGLAGAGLAYWMAGDARLPLFASVRKAGPWLLAGGVLACLPDVDYLPGLARGYLNTTHQQATHSVAWVLLAALGIWLVGRARRPAGFGGRTLAFLLILIGSHLAIDLVTADHFAPYGIPLGAPFSDVYVRGPVALLPAWEKTALADLGSRNNLRTLGIELGAGLAFATGCGIAKRLKTALG